MSAFTRILVAGAAVAACGLIQPASSYASFHWMQIEQVIGGVNGDVTAQAIQLRQRFGGQNFVSSARLIVRNATGAGAITVVDMTTSNCISQNNTLCNGTAGRRILIASANFLNQTGPTTVPDFMMTNLIPASYLAAGSMTFEDDFGTVYWRLSWGGGDYMGTGTVLSVAGGGNDNDGNANPPYGGSLPSTSLQALLFSGLAGDQSTNNAAQYAITPGAAVFTNNATTTFTVSGPPGPVGACCVDSTGMCTNNVTQSTCEGGGNRYGGDGSTCSTINPPCVAPTGACCDDATGVCTEGVALGACKDAGARTGGPDSTCETIDPLCPPTGACCDDSAMVCTEARTQATCEGQGFRYGGDDSDCTTITPSCTPPAPPIPIALELVAGCAPCDGNTATGTGTLSSPLGITHAGDGTGRLFIHDQIGLIRVLDAGGKLLPDPMLDISALLPPLGIDFGGGFPIFDERGLLGLAFHPDFATNGKFYVRYSKPRASTGSEPCDLDTVVPPDPGAVPPSSGRCHEEVLAEYTMMGDPLTSNVADPSSEVILFRWDKPQWNHNAGHIEFGPDGYLYISTGDGGGANDGLCDSPPSHGNPPADGPGGNGQNRESKLGKMIRIDVDGTDGPGGLYGIPPTNPFVGATPGLDEVYAYGFRNPFRFSFDNGPGGDNALYLADVGQNIYEEVDDVVIGGNYGWAIEEGAHCFDPGCPPVLPLPGCGDSGLIRPISEYTHAEGGTAIIGGYVYRGPAYPQLVSKYVYGDDASNFFAPSGRLYYFELSGPEMFVRKEFFIAPNGDPLGKFLKGFGRDADGEIYIAASDVIGPNSTAGVIFKIVPPPAPIIVWDPSEDSPARAGRSLTFSVAPSAVASGSPVQSAIKVTMVDLQHPNPRNLPQYPPPSYATFDTGTHGTCAGATTGPNFNGHHCSSDAECVGPNGAITTDDGTCTLPGPACTAIGETSPPTANGIGGCARWVGMPGTFYEAQGPPLSGPYRASRLQCAPFYWDWASEPGGQVIVVGAEILPSSEYGVQTYPGSCKGNEDGCPGASGSVPMFTRRKGDLDAPYQMPSPATLTQADVLDISQAVASVKHVAGAPAHSRAQVQPNVPDLNADPNVLDIVEAVDSVKRIAYSFSGPCVCPSTQTCGASCAGCTGLCLKSCVGGLNDGQVCNNNTHCPGVCSGGTNPGVVCPSGVPGGANCAGGGTCSGACGAVGTCYDKCGRCTP